MSEKTAQTVKTKSIAKRFLIVFSVALCLLFTTATMHYFFVERAERIERETSELLNIRLGKAAIERDLQDVISDLTFLARYSENSGIFLPGNLDARQALAEQFRVFSEQKDKYHQIRVLDETGQEIVRVNYNEGEPVATGEALLQNKSDRYYFIETWAIDGRNAYISPFDLNIEHGEIEIPEVPMVRFGTLMFDEGGNKRGVLLLNYLGSTLIDDFQEATANIVDHAMLLNSDGYWLSSTEKDREWGFMYGREDTLAKYFPDAWRRINAQDTGQFYNRDGLFSFTTIYPISSSQGNLDDGLGSLPADRSYNWKAVSHLPPQNFSANLGEFLRQNIPLYSAMFFLLAASSFVVALTRFHHLQAVSEVEAERSFRELLERRVEERTSELKTAQVEKDMVVQHLIHAEKMTAIGTMASGIGHEINNPLYAILGLAEAIRDDGSREQARRYAGKILFYTKDIAAIVKNLTGYARPFSGAEHEPIDINKAIDKAVSMVKRSLYDDRITIKTDLSDLPGLSAHSEEIHQVFFNVVRNGVQSIDGDGTLVITSRYDGEKIVIHVKDNGKGIAPEDLSKVFDPFFTTKDPDQGEGMGLYVVHQIIQKYKGSISLESVVGKGTTCAIEFPATSPGRKEGT
ncbi:MAG: HAMP domain-containing histidine kinase [Rhodobacteraceae bacterium]|nr:HAMP domain-containing histidine kinase [Paracoccaceae bacterium]